MAGKVRVQKRVGPRDGKVLNQPGLKSGEQKSQRLMIWLGPELLNKQEENIFDE